MIRGIHYFSTELKAKSDVIPRGCFKKQLVWVSCGRGARRVLVAHGLYRDTKPPYRISEQERFVNFNPLSAGDAFKRIHTVFPQLKFDRN